jgi:phosphoribosylanthranilate isomerase
VNGGGSWHAQVQLPTPPAVLVGRGEPVVVELQLPSSTLAVQAWKARIGRVSLFLLDAKPPTDAAYPGGQGKTFDWQVLKGIDPRTPFLLSGGLTPENVGKAIATVKSFGLALAGVDVSSGVESAPGVKDITMIQAFIRNARTASLEATP